MYIVKLKGEAVTRESDQAGNHVEALVLRSLKFVEMK
jgi:hypothetical protein